MTRLEPWEPLIRAALQVRERAYAPYSRYRVGAALQGADGTVYVGCNIENASFPVTLCAERAALAQAVSAGCRDFVALVIATEGPAVAGPCGMCRQALNEFARRLPVLLVTAGGSRKEVELSALLPESFGPEMLAPAAASPVTGES